MTTFLRFVDPGATSLLDKVDFRGIIATTGKGLVLTFFLMLVALADAAGRAWVLLVQSFEDMIRLIVSAPSLTLGEIQQRATEIASREILDFGLFALPVSVVASLTAIFAVVFFVNVFWRP